MRTADGLGIKTIITIGYTPHMKQKNDARLPHVVKRAETQIAKTALGAEKHLENIHFNSYNDFLELKDKSYKILALEQSQQSKPINNYKLATNAYLILGEEKFGIPKKILNKVDDIVEIEMNGTKNSFNVSVAFAIASFSLTK